MLSGRFGDAGRTLVIEARLSGPEASLIAIVDGTHYRAFPLVRDHKRLNDGDAGPNTGGMGVVTLSDVPASEQAALAEHILTPLLTTLREAGITYCGVIFAGLLKSETGWQVLEFNCRFGDPEAQVLLGAMQGDLAVLLDAAIRVRGGGGTRLSRTAPQGHDHPAPASHRWRAVISRRNGLRPRRGLDRHGRPGAQYRGGSPRSEPSPPKSV
jgi:phosphoribosylamine--glycine ligase